VRRFLIDTDTASDDAVALVMALRAPDVAVEAITVVAGNVPLDRAVQNALYTVEVAGASTPVHAGRAAPLLRTLDTAQYVHGRDGMGDIGLALTGRTPASSEAVAVIRETIRRHAGAITLVALGPLTNIALALLVDPALARQVERCVIMGGASDAVGNVTPVSEYNFWADPEAAAIVFGSGLPIEMVGWDISRKYAVVDDRLAAHLRDLGPLGAFCVDINGVVAAYCREISELDGFDLPDPVAMAVALDPSIATATEHAYVAIDRGDHLTRGQSIVHRTWDPHVERHPPNAVVVTETDRRAFVALLEHTAAG
jgi:purine nucleosidase